MHRFIREFPNKASLYINAKDKWLWIRIHKTAGTSIWDGNLVDNPNVWNIVKTPDHKESAQAWIDQVTTEELSKYAIWTVVREPLDRFISACNMFEINPNFFAKHFFDIRREEPKIKRHTERQVSFTFYEGNPMFNRLLRFEFLNDDMLELCQELAIPFIPLPWLNISNKIYSIEDVNRETIDFVNKYYDLDFKRFNYLKMKP